MIKLGLQGIYSKYVNYRSNNKEKKFYILGRKKFGEF